MSAKVSKWVAGAVALTLASAGVQASESNKNPDEVKGRATGMATGAIAGAFIGGPFGAGVGFIVGAISGSQVGQARATYKKAAKLTEELADARGQLTQVQTELAGMAAKQVDGDIMLAQVAQRLRTDVLFRTKSAELDQTSSAKLKELGAVLSNYPMLVIDIDGYADPRGGADDNMELSQTRAAAVRAALIVGGANPDNIRMLAHGEQLSTATKGDMEAYAWERRVSLSVTTTPGSTSDQVARAE